MCGRFTLTQGLQQLQTKFEFEFTEELIPRYNIAPSQQILTVASDGYKRAGRFMKWGLVPYWAKDIKIGYKMINARAEGIDTKASFKTPFRRKRCLILADGFYEWKKTEGGKQPYRFIMKDKDVFAFAGLWDTWTKDGSQLHSCTIITTDSNTVTEDVHDRMPVILPSEVYNDWLNPDLQDTDYLKSLLVPYAAEKMDKYPVSSLVNSPKNNSVDLLLPMNSL
ncbi:putative SOS response-associated peptidase YedK [Peribacillus deserti]|uniref:Abasic site processing protein n=1 Tax=Peribacillus deserti TaxID=673318 RepID=A0ABS2QIT1_9BACI|nr:SOS response-associated peptidase [Peribacillus deserti]MBM7692714.1 putative SOS response-associated peptidase YedK [Peribacillus deserti]